MSSKSIPMFSRLGYIIPYQYNLLDMFLNHLLHPGMIGCKYLLIIVLRTQRRKKSAQELQN